MRSSLSEAFARLDESRAKLRAALDGIPAMLRDQSPSVGRWSAAAVVEQLAPR